MSISLSRFSTALLVVAALGLSMTSAYVPPSKSQSVLPSCSGHGMYSSCSACSGPGGEASIQLLFENVFLIDALEEFIQPMYKHEKDAELRRIYSHRLPQSFEHPNCRLYKQYTKLKADDEAVNVPPTALFDATLYDLYLNKAKTLPERTVMKKQLPSLDSQIRATAIQNEVAFLKEARGESLDAPCNEVVQRRFYCGARLCSTKNKKRRMHDVRHMCTWINRATAALPEGYSDKGLTKYIEDIIKKKPVQKEGIAAFRRLYELVFLRRAEGNHDAAVQSFVEVMLDHVNAHGGDHKLLLRRAGLDDTFIELADKVVLLNTWIVENLKKDEIYPNEAEIFDAPYAQQIRKIIGEPSNSHHLNGTKRRGTAMNTSSVDRTVSAKL